MDATSPVRMQIARPAVWGIAAVGLVAVAVIAWVAHDRGGAPSVQPLPTPAHVALVYAKPVGARIIGEGREVVYVASPTDQHPHRLGAGTYPLISPDGRTVAYLVGSPGHPVGLRLVSLVGGRSKVVRLLGAPLVWSWDSRYLAVGGGQGLRILDTHTLRTTTIRRPDASENFSFSPDGSTLAFQHSTGSGTDIYTVSRRGGPIHRLTDDHRSAFPLWGPGGIAFERFGTDRCMNCGGDVWLMDASGGDLRQVSHTRAGIYPAAWSADGQRILAAYPATFNGKLYAVDVASGTTRPLTPFVGDLNAQGLSRNGRTVLAAIGCGETVNPYGIVETIPFGGGHPTVIARGPCRASSNF